MRPRDAGTRWETALTRRLHDSWRLAEGGLHDAGDLAWRLPTGDIVVVEAKRRQNLSVHTALAKAKAKSKGADLPFVPLATVLIWDRPVLKEGNERRSRAGEPVVVVGLDDFVTLIGGED